VVLHRPAATGAAHTTAHVSQDDAGNRLLLLAQRFVEGLEGARERLHALGALGHPFARAIEHVGQWRGRCTLPPLLHSLLEVLSGLLPRGKTRTQLLLDGRP
jgi:hypothetical protein